MEKRTTVYTPMASPAFLLALTFIILKLCGVISWSWLWVLSPLWIGAVLVLAVLACVVGVTSLVALAAWWLTRKD